jgi:hypothetical protein
VTLYKDEWGGGKGGGEHILTLVLTISKAGIVQSVQQWAGWLEFDS